MNNSEKQKCVFFHIYVIVLRVALTCYVWWLELHLIEITKVLFRRNNLTKSCFCFPRRFFPEYKYFIDQRGNCESICDQLVSSLFTFYQMNVIVHFHSEFNGYR